MTFHAATHQWDRNITDGANTTATPAVLHAPRGKQTPGIAITTDGRARLVITTSEALRLANEIADIATNQQNN